MNGIPETGLQKKADFLVRTDLSTGLAVPESSGQVVLELKLNLMDSMRAVRKQALESRHERFVSYWQEEGHRLLENLKVFISTVPEHLLDPELGAAFGPATGASGDTGEAHYVYALWTIGKELEEQVSAFFEEHKSMQALFLDLAGTKVLLELHKTVQTLVRDKLASPNGFNIIKELYPGNSRPGSLNLSKVISCAGAEKEVSPVAGNQMLSPRKSMYTFFVLGSGPENLQSSVEPCSDCSGMQCLYYQLGGCHRTGPGSGLGPDPS
jgi:hypothetical protein